MTRKHRLGDLQLAIMHVLWQGGEATVADVHRALEEERGLATTTVATMLAKMETKGVVGHRTEGRRYVYRPTVSEADVRRTMVDELTRGLFEGNALALVSHLLSEHEIDRDDLDELRELIAQRQEEEKS